jgi:hypothetical protein
MPSYLLLNLQKKKKKHQHRHRQLSLSLQINRLKPEQYSRETYRISPLLLEINGFNFLRDLFDEIEGGEWRVGRRKRRKERVKLGNL